METIRAILCLQDTPYTYEFTIDRGYDPPTLHIPGNHRGPDLCFPHRPEQEEWLNGLTEYVKPYWYCQWKFVSKEAYHEFVRYLGSLDKG